jgi:cysteine-rich repeat protein
VRLRFETLAAAAALSIGACAGLVLLVPTACIPDLPSSASAVPEAALDAAPEASARAPTCGDGVVELALGEQCDPGKVALDAAAHAGCSATCQVECVDGFHWSRNDHCYAVVLPATNQISDWTTRCTGASHVVTFASEEELSSVVGGLDAGPFWVGMYQGLDKYDSVVASLEPAWEPGCTGCFAHTPDPDLPLPGADAGGQACVEGFPDLDASWQQTPCAGGKRIQVICEREPAGRLSQPCSLVDGGECFDLRFTHGSKSYVYVKLAAPADTAEQQCEGVGGTLVVLQSRDEREQLWKELARMSGAGLPTTIWIGLSIPDGGAEWTWADDASMDAYPSPWGYRQPHDGGDRAYLLQNNGNPPLVDETLARVETTTVFAPFVCQIPARDE